MVAKVSETSLGIIARYRAGERVVDIAADLSMPYQNVLGTVHRAIDRGDVVSHSSRVPAPKRLSTLLNDPPLKLGGIRSSIENGMGIDTYKRMEAYMVANGYETIGEYLVELAIETHYQAGDK